MNTENVKPVVQKLLDIIKHHKLEVMEHYPNDVLVCDAEMLEKAWFPGARIAWAASTSSTQLIVLNTGSKSTREMLQAIGSYSMSYKVWYLLSNVGGKVVAKELTAEQFATLEDDSTLTTKQIERGRYQILENGAPVAGVTCTYQKCEDGSHNPPLLVEVTSEVARPLIRAKIQLLANDLATKFHGSLFWRGGLELSWEKASKAAA
jgi:hypothetical protein